MPAQNLPGLVLDRAHPLVRGLVGWWPMNEGAGTRINDLSGFGNHGTLTSGAKMWGSSLGGGIYLDGTDDYALIPHSPSLAIVGDITLSCWVNSAFGSFGMLINKGASGVTNPYQFFVFGGGGNRIVARGNGTVEAAFYATDSGIPLSKWTHVVATMSGTTAYHYRNGVPGGSGALSTTVADSGGALYLGRRGDGYYTQMLMAHARIYNRALSAVEVAQLYADPLAGALAPVRARLNVPVVVPPPAAIAAPPTADRLWNRGYVGRIFRRGEKGS